MRRARLIAIFVLLSAIAAIAQIGGGGISVQGAVTAGHCVSFVSASAIQDAGGICGGSGSSPGGSVGAFQFNNTVFGGTTLTDMSYSGHTITFGSTGLVDMSAMSVTGGLKIPTTAGAAPTADSFIAFNSTNHLPVFGSNGSTLTYPSTIAAVGTKFLTSFTNTTGVFTQAQPAFTDISGSHSCAQSPALTGDATTSAGSCATTVVAINGTTLSALATGPLFNTTGTGVPTVGTRTGNTTQLATWTGATTANRCVDTDINGNLQITSGDCSSGGIAGLTQSFGVDALTTSSVESQPWTIFVTSATTGANICQKITNAATSFGSTAVYDATSISANLTCPAADAAALFSSVPDGSIVKLPAQTITIQSVSRAAGDNNCTLGQGTLTSVPCASAVVQPRITVQGSATNGTIIKADDTGCSGTPKTGCSNWFVRTATITAVDISSPPFVKLTVSGITGPTPVIGELVDVQTTTAGNPDAGWGSFRVCGVGSPSGCPANPSNTSISFVNENAVASTAGKVFLGTWLWSLGADPVAATNIVANNGTPFANNVRLQNIALDCRRIAGCIDWGSSTAQENSYVQYVSERNADFVGWTLINGGASGFSNFGPTWDNYVVDSGFSNPACHYGTMHSYVGDNHTRGFFGLGTQVNLACLSSTNFYGYNPGPATTSWSIASNVVTFNGANFQAGTTYAKLNSGTSFTPAGLVTGSFLNGQVLSVCAPPTSGCATPTNSAITAQFTHANTSATESGTLQMNTPAVGMKIEGSKGNSFISGLHPEDVFTGIKIGEGLPSVGVNITNYKGHGTIVNDIVISSNFTSTSDYTFASIASSGGNTIVDQQQSITNTDSNVGFYSYDKNGSTTGFVTTGAAINKFGTGISTPSIVVTGATSGSYTLSATATGGTLTTQGGNFTVTSGGNVTAAGSGTFGGAITSGGASNNCGASSPCFSGVEGVTQPTPTASTDFLHFNSTAHCIQASYNGSTLECIPLLNGSFTAGGLAAINAQLGSGSAWDLDQASAHNVAVPQNCNDTSGSGTAQVCNTVPTFTPAAKDCVIYNTTTANTGSLTVNVNSGGAKTVKKWLGAGSLASGDLPANTPVDMCLDTAGFWEVQTIGNAPGGTGTVTSVDFNVNSGLTSGIFTVSGRPVTSSGTINVALTGNSGGIPFFSSGSVLSSSAVLAANAIVVGGGAAVTPATVANTSVTAGAITLGADNSVAGTLQLANGSAAAHTIWSSGATTTNTIQGFAAVPTTGHLIDCTVSSTTCLLHDSGVVTANVVTEASNAAQANTVLLSGGADKTAVAADFYGAPYYIPAANCNNATGGAGWSIPSGGTVTCRAGTNNLGGFITITDTSSTFAQFTVMIPGDWDSATRPFIRFFFSSASDTTNGHTVIPQIKVSCPTATNGTTSDDATFSAAQSSSTVTFGASAVANGFYSGSNVQIGSTQMTGCVANGMMIVQVGRATDTATGNINFYGASLTFPHLNPGAAQAN